MKESKVSHPCIVENITSDKDREHFAVFLHGEIVSDLSEYHELFGLLSQTKPCDIDLYLDSSPGGDWDVGLTISLKMISCDHYITVHVANKAQSSSAIIALSGSDLELGKFAHLLFHPTKFYGLSGKSRTVREHLEIFDAAENRVMLQICMPFLSKKEVKDVNDHRTFLVWGNTPDFRRRYFRHFDNKGKAALIKKAYEESLKKKEKKEEDANFPADEYEVSIPELPNSVVEIAHDEEE